MIKSFCLKKAFLLLTGIFFISGIIQAQSIAISGSVSDATTGDLLPGVSVIIKGTTTGSITNFDGVYNLNANQGDILVYSFIGYVAQEVTIGQQAQLNIQLKPDVVGVEEVVVIGYGSVKKEDATGSISAVSSKDFNAGAIASPQDLIVGKTAGVQITSTGGAPGAGSTIRIRGGSSLNASNDPLIVIDGVPIDTEGVEGMQNPLNTVNPNDIETFTVLKDASATAIYGSRASNGVIIITTKNGKSGDVVKFDYSGNVSVATAANTLDVMNASQYSSFIKDTYGEDSEAYRNVTSYEGVNTNWQDEVYRTSIGTDHNLSVSGGVKDLPYRLSFGYTNQEGIVETSAMERITVGLNLNPTFFNEHLKTAVNAKYMHVSNNFSNDAAIGGSVTFDPTKPVYDESSKYGGYYTWIDNDGNPVTIAPMNPVAQLNLHDNQSKVNRYIINAKFDYKLHFAPTITATLNMGIDGSTSEGRTIVQPTAAWSSPNDPERAGEYSPYNQDKNNKTLDMYLTYNESFGKHNIKAMGGYAWQHFHREGNNVTYNYAETNEVTPYRAYEAQNYLVSFFGRAEYNYDNRYLVNATVRADGTSRFSEDNRWGYFPAVGLAWRMKNEAFMTDIDWLSDLKLRLGWGITGQQGVTEDLPYQGSYVRSNGTAMYPWDGGYINTMRPDGYDENIKWEETTTYNAGLDFGFFNNKLAGSFEFYHRITDDLLNVVPVAAGANLTNELLTNVGSLENTGVELNLTYRAIAKQDLFWEIGGNLTYNQNEITSLTNGDDPTYLGIQTGGISGGTGNNVQIHSVGYPANSFFVYQQVYDANGKPLEGVYVDQNGDGIYNDFDKVRVGQAAPTLLVGINSRLEYKNWDFAFSGRMQFGATVYNDNKSNMGVAQDTYNSGGNFLSNRLTSTPSGFNSFQYWSSEYLEDASFFRMDNITAGYRFNKLGGTDMSLKITGTAQNVFVITQYEGVDPEVSGGIDNNFYPRPRTFILGVNLNF
ncbi:SusC/RagA family TonB-linked outer membrane protein [Saccharicrinis aurantiacus]|uniref:SusC/RagA family TonB-linked outer membrane protein n=1 Tax=Saccharicrinis aurantiacus TaxID=1849719 RepID=UPI00094F96F8|nr:TonB-dependent receptor [Saccharicrinis aurantiacus]